MPQITVSAPQYAALKELADTLLTQNRYATRKPVFYQIGYDSEESLAIVDRMCLGGEEQDAQHYLQTFLDADSAREELSTCDTFAALATFGPAHRVPVLHQAPSVRYEGCWLTHAGASAYLEAHRAKFRNPRVYVNHSVDPVLDQVLTWIEGFTTIPTDLV